MACEICKKPYIPTDDRSFDSNEKPHVCNVCGKSFSLKIQLKRHALSHGEDVPYICHTCEKHLENTSYNLRLSKKPSFTCETCSKCFLSKRLLLRHSSEHTSENVVHCDECGEGFKNARSVKRHAVVHKRKRNSSKSNLPKEAPGTLNQCNDCGKTFSRLQLLEKHQLSHKYHCAFCGVDFPSNSLLEEHRVSGACQSRNNNAVDSFGVNANSDTDGRKHVCAMCNQSFARKSALEGHVATHFTDGRESVVEDDSDIDADFRCDYKEAKVIEPPKQEQCLPKLKIRRSFQCEKCEVVCASKISYEKHMACHEKVYMCRVCNEEFSCREFYKRHKLTHEARIAEQIKEEKERKTYKCQLCQTEFCKKRHLRKHLKCHFNLDPNDTSSLSSEDIQIGKRPRYGPRNKKFPCRYCGKRFAGETCLKRHEAKHSGEIVKKPTSDEGETHTGDNAEIHTSDNAKIHTGDNAEIHTGDNAEKHTDCNLEIKPAGCSPKGKKVGKKPKCFICEFCQEDFSGRKSNFLKHRLSHTPEVCGICDARFVDRASLREHCRIHIGTEEGRRFVECSQKALDAKNGVVQPEPKVEYIYLVLR